MAFDVDKLGRAMLDVSRRRHDLPTRQENIDARAMEDLKRRQAMAAAGLTEAKAEALPEQMDMQRRMSEATIGARGAQAEAARALAAQRGEGPEDDWEITPDGRHMFNPRTQELKPLPEGTPALIKPQSQGSGIQGAQKDFFQDPETGEWKYRLVPGTMGGEYTVQPLAAERQKMSQMNAAGLIVGSPDDPDTIFKLAMDLNAGNTGIVDRVIGSIVSLAGKAGYTGTIAGKSAADANIYNSQIRGQASILAKSFGESGRLSDQDIERTVQMFPIIGEGPEVTRRKMERIQSLISALAGLPGAAKGSAQALANEQQAAQLLDSYQQEVYGGQGLGVLAAPTGGEPNVNPVDRAIEEWAASQKGQ
jgi:hypothetical protein